MGIPIATACTALNLPDGTTLILVGNKGLFFGQSMEHSLIPPAQLWDNGLICNITPKSKSHGNSIFGIYDPETNMHLPFSLYD